MTNTTTTTQYEPPKMENPTVIDLAKTDQNWFSFDDTQDVVFIDSDPNHVVTHKLQVQGGHNVEILGLNMANEQQGSTGTIALYGVSGQAYIDGVHIDNAKVSGTDGIDIAGGEGTSLVVQNTSIENVNGARDGGQTDGGNGHADGIQVQGSLGGEVDLFNVHVSTNYQGLFLAPQASVNPSHINLTNVDLHYTGATDNGGNPISYLLWLNDDPNSETHVPTTIDNVWVEARDGQEASLHAVWPTPNSGYATEDNGQITFQNMNASGSVSIGDHETFAPLDMIGGHFRNDAEILTGGAGAASPDGSGSAPEPSTPDQSAGAPETTPAETTPAETLPPESPSGSMPNVQDGNVDTSGLHGVSQADFNAFVGLMDAWVGQINDDMGQVAANTATIASDLDSFFQQFHQAMTDNHWIDS